MRGSSTAARDVNAGKSAIANNKAIHLGIILRLTCVPNASIVIRIGRCFRCFVRRRRGGARLIRLVLSVLRLRLRPRRVGRGLFQCTARGAPDPLAEPAEAAFDDFARRFQVVVRRRLRRTRPIGHRQLNLTARSFPTATDGRESVSPRTRKRVGRSIGQRIVAIHGLAGPFVEAEHAELRPAAARCIADRLPIGEDQKGNIVGLRQHDAAIADDRRPRPKWFTRLQAERVDRTVDQWVIRQAARWV